MNTEQSEHFKKLIKDFLLILKANEDKGSREKALFCSYSRTGKTSFKILDYREQEKFYAPIRYLLSLKIISSKYSETWIKNRIEILYHETLAGKDNFYHLIKELIDSLVKWPNKKYCVWSGIENIQVLDDGAYRLIDATIGILKKDGIPVHEEHVRLIIDFKEELKLLDKPSIYAEVEAVDDFKAIEMASDKFMLSFNFLRLYFPILNLL